MLDSKKARTSIKDLRMDRAKIKGRDDQIRAAGEKLAGDKEQLERMGQFVEGMDIPAEDKTRTLAHFAEQQKILESTFEAKVEQTSAQEIQQLDSLQKEASDYANSSAQNKEKLDGFRKQSDMNDSSIKEAAQEQGKYAIDYQEERDQILEEKAAMDGAVADLKRRVITK
jgi:hypothetical protein